MTNRLLVLACFVLLQACVSPANNGGDVSKPCTDASLERIESLSNTADAQGHGPDIGSDEWHSVVEFRLGVRGSASLPKRHTTNWCDYIGQQLNANSE